MRFFPERGRIALQMEAGPAHDEPATVVGDQGGDVSDRPEERPEERRRTGPLGGEEETRQVPSQRPANGEDGGEATQRFTPGDDRTDDGHGGTDPSLQEETRVAETPGRATPEAERETRVIRAGGAEERTGELGDTQSDYPRGYFEAADEREARLRDMYGGVDWLASFLGFVFAAVAGTFLGGIAGVIVAPLGFSLDLGAGSLGPAAITGLVVVAVIIFLTYLFGGYVAGRLARFDGARNGAMTVAWSIVMAALVAVGGVLSLPFLDALGGFMDETVAPTINGLIAAGLIGVAVLVGALLVALLGGLAGGRLGSRYHNEIDRTS
jgi:hypothetical protein